MERNVKRIRMKNPVGAFAGRSWSVPSVGRSPPILLSTAACRLITFLSSLQSPSAAVRGTSDRGASDGGASDEWEW